jgi:excisionase family DNA binding protein
MTKDIYLTVTQAAEFLGCTKEEVKQLVQDGKLTPIGDNGYRYLLSMKEVNKKAGKLSN